VNIDATVAVVVAVFIAIFVIDSYRALRGRVRPIDLLTPFLLTVGGLVIGIELLLQAEPPASPLCGPCYTFKYVRQANAVLAFTLLPMITFFIDLLVIYIPIGDIVKRLRNGSGKEPRRTLDDEHLELLAPTRLCR